MKTIAIVALTALLCLGVTVEAQSELTFRVGPTAGLRFGQTSYDLEFPIVAGEWHGASELIFPLETAVVGLEADGTLKQNGITRLTFGVRFGTGVSDPGDPMTDRDWDIYYGQLNQDYSYTESDMEASAVMLEAEVAAVMARNEGMDISLVVGVGYQKVSQTALNFKGTQAAYTDSTIEFYLVDQEGEALEYDISYLTPHVGFMPRLYLGPQATFELKAAVTPVRISDTDNHLLRHFETNSSGWGWGGLGHAEFVYQLKSDQGKRAPYLKLSGDLAYYAADLEEYRYWYGDDPITPDDDETGHESVGLQHNIRTTQYGFGLQLGMTF